MQEQKPTKKAVYVLLAEGFETLEALTPVDILRRAQWPVFTVSTTGERSVCSGQKIRLDADLLLDELTEVSAIAALYIPGGLPAARTLSQSPRVVQLVQDCEAAGVIVASICAGPLSFKSAGIARRYKGTCYPGCEGEIGYREHVEALFVSDGPLLSSRSAATSLYAALELLRRLAGDAAAQSVKNAIGQDFVEKALRE